MHTAEHESRRSSSNLQMEKQNILCTQRKLGNESFKLFMRQPNKQFTQFTISLFCEFCLSKVEKGEMQNEKSLTMSTRELKAK